MNGRGVGRGAGFGLRLDGIYGVCVVSGPAIVIVIRCRTVMID